MLKIYVSCGTKKTRFPPPKINLCLGKSVPPPKINLCILWKRKKTRFSIIFFLFLQNLKRERGNQKAEKNHLKTKNAYRKIKKTNPKIAPRARDVATAESTLPAHRSDLYGCSGRNSSPSLVALCIIQGVRGPTSTVPCILLYS